MVQYFAVSIRFSEDNCMKHFKTWALLCWWWIRRRGGQNFPRGPGPPLALALKLPIKAS